jgi:hypothetical protein
MLKGEESDESPMDAPAAPVLEGEPVENDAVNAQIQQFNQSLKEEKMLERVEKFLNEGSLQLSQNERLCDYLYKPEYLVLFASMIGKPHQYQSATTVPPTIH